MPSHPCDVGLHTSAWVTGYRLSGQMGPVLFNIPYDSRHIMKCLLEAVEGLQLQAHILGANSVIGMETTVNPFEPNPYIEVLGTAVSLEVLP